MLRIKRSNLSIIDKLLILSILFNSGTALRQNTNIASYTMIVLFVIYILLNKPKKKFGVIALYVVVLSILIIAQSIVKAGIENAIIAIQYASLLFVCLGYASIKSQKNTERIDFLCKLIVFFSTISLFLFAMVMIGVLPYTSTPQGYYTFYYIENFYIEYRSMLGFRNSSIFWEPGMFQIFVNFALIYYLYKPNTKRKGLIIAVLIASAVSTYSTTGYALTAAIVVYYIMAYRKINIKKIMLVVLMIVGIVYFAPYLLENIYSKMTYGNSFSHRLNDLALGFNIFLKSPIIGHGVDTNVYQDAYSLLYNNARGNSNGLMNILIYFGLLGVVIYGYVFIRLIRSLSVIYGKQTLVPYIMWLLLSIMTEPIILHPFIFFLIGFEINVTVIKNESHNTKHLSQYKMIDTV